MVSVSIVHQGALYPFSDESRCQGCGRSELTSRGRLPAYKDNDKCHRGCLIDTGSWMLGMPCTALEPAVNIKGGPASAQ